MWHHRPIEVATVVVWHVIDIARAVCGIDDFTSYVHTQSESAVRQLTRSYRSVNAQIEATLVDTARRANRLKRQSTLKPPEDSEDKAAP